MNKKIVIAIGREFGSGGREIARKVAEKLDIKIYDKELISLIAKKSGYSRCGRNRYKQLSVRSFFGCFFGSSYS